VLTKIRRRRCGRFPIAGVLSKHQGVGKALDSLRTSIPTICEEITYLEPRFTAIFGQLMDEDKEWMKDEAAS
jgi:hypothetical protein